MVDCIIFYLFNSSGGDCECSNEALVEDDRLAAPDFRNFQQKIDISDLKKITGK